MPPRRSTRTRTAVTKPEPKKSVKKSTKEPATKSRKDIEFNLWSPELDQNGFPVDGKMRMTREEEANAIEAEIPPPKPARAPPIEKTKIGRSQDAVPHWKSLVAFAIEQALTKPVLEAIEKSSVTNLPGQEPRWMTLSK